METSTLYRTEPIKQAVETHGLNKYAKLSGVDAGTVLRAIEMKNTSIVTLHKLAVGAGVCICKLLGCNCNHNKKRARIKNYPV